MGGSDKDWGGEVNKRLTTAHVQRQILTTMAASVNNPQATKQFARSVEQMGAFYDMPTTSIEERDAVVQKAIASAPHLFPGLNGL